MSTLTIPTITNDDELARAIDEYYPLAAALETSDAEPSPYVLGLRDAIDAYERRAGHAPEPPQTVAGLLEVEMFKRKLRQRGLAEVLDVPETRLSEILRGKRGMNLDFARRLFVRLSVPAEVILKLQDVGEGVAMSVTPSRRKPAPSKNKKYPRSLSPLPHDRA